jgi:8-oxo-dGTP pyrophosphatase MutT (NUDIX family)
MTRRHSLLIAFPKAWVLPGGHLDPGESLKECCIRELHEECGLEIKQDKSGTFNFHGKPVEIEPFFSFESAPTPKQKGNLPPFSHLIVFFKVQLRVPAAEIKLKLCPNEVEAAAWLSPDYIRCILTQQPAPVERIDGLEL